jgi:hypothetical protein
MNDRSLTEDEGEREGRAHRTPNCIAQTDLVKRLEIAGADGAGRSRSADPGGRDEGEAEHRSERTQT